MSDCKNCSNCDCFESEEPVKLNTVTCLNCGWVHFEVSKKYAEDAVSSYNQYVNNLPENMRIETKMASLEDYLYCFRCNGSYKDFRDYKDGDINGVHTIQPIMNREES